MPKAELDRMRRHLAALEAEVAHLRERSDPSSMRGEAARIMGEIDDLHPGTDPFAAAVRTTRMPMVIADPRRPDTPIVFVNDAFCRLAGYERDEIVGRNCRFLQGPGTDPDTVREIGDAVRAELPVKADILNYRKDGEPFWNRLLMAPVRNAAGEITYFFASQVDVTGERRRLEELEGDKAILSAEVAKTLRNQQRVESQLRQLNDTLEQRVAARTRDLDRVWRNAQDLLVVTDMQGTLLAVNPATASVLGRSRHEMVGASVFAFVHPDDHPPLVDGALDPDLYGEPRHVTNRCLHADGSVVWVAWMSVAEGGHVYGYGRNVTAELEQAEALRKVEDALRQSQKMEAVGQLTGGLAHNFNNLLTGITGSLDLLGKRLRQGRTDNLERYIDTAQQASRRGAALTHRLLAFSRRQTLDPKPTDVDRLAAGMADLIRRTVGPAVSVSVVTGPDAWNALVDPNQLENALLNLCINARDAMPDGGRLTVETANRVIDARGGAATGLESGDYLALGVSDTGMGMTPEVVARAFDPFFTTKPLGSGTGLGLSMIYGFARQSGGQVRIHSHPGSGTTVTLFLPRHGEQASEAEPIVDASAPPRGRCRARPCSSSTTSRPSACWSPTCWRTWVMPRWRPGTARPAWPCCGRTVASTCSSPTSGSPAA